MTPGDLPRWASPAGAPLAYQTAAGKSSLLGNFLKSGPRRRRDPHPGKPLYLEVHGGVPLLVAAELVVLAGQDGVEDNPGDGGHRQAGHTDHRAPHLEGHRPGVVHADGQHHDEGGDNDIAAVGEVHPVQIGRAHV